MEAIDVGLEDGFKPAESALAKRRSQRHEVMEALVAAMEVAVISAEQDGINGPGCCAPEHLEALADVLVEARSLAIPGEEELLNAATRLLEFELKRSEAVRTLNVKLRQHARDMEKIVDDLQQTTNAPGISAGSRATGILEAALDTTTPQWTRQSFLRRGSRRSKDHGGVADEVPAIPGVGMEAMEMRPEPWTDSDGAGVFWIFSFLHWRKYPRFVFGGWKTPILWDSKTTNQEHFLTTSSTWSCKETRYDDLIWYMYVYLQYT